MPLCLPAPVPPTRRRHGGRGGVRHPCPPQRRRPSRPAGANHRRHLEEALWTFVKTPGVEPTNNFMERLLRRAVLWRKRSFGCWSVSGCRFVERILTVVQTRRLQGQSVLEYLHDALLAHRKLQPCPRLVPEQ